jgi:DNA-binding MarR family transcriptional regulator
MPTDAATQTSTEALVRELFSLMRGLKSMHHTPPAGHQFRLDPPAFGVLWAIAERGPLRPSALAGHLCLDLSTVSRHLSGLETAGFLARETDPGDRRAHLIRVSPAGEQALADDHEARLAGLSVLLEDFSEAERQRFLRCLVHFNANIDNRRRLAADAAGEEGPSK